MLDAGLGRGREAHQDDQCLLKASNPSPLQQRPPPCSAARLACPCFGVVAALNLTWSRKEREAALKVRWNCSAMFDCTDADLAWVPGDEGPAGGLGDSSEGHVMVAEAAAAHTFMCGPTGKDSKQRARLSSLSPATIGRVREVQAEMAHHQATQVAANIHG